MRTLSTLSVAVLALWLAGCGGHDLGGDDVSSQLEQDFGHTVRILDVFGHRQHLRRALSRRLGCL